MNEQSLIVAEEAKPLARIAAMSPAEMLSTAIERGASIEVLEKLFTLHDRFELNEARKAFSAAISLAKSEIKPVIRSRSAHNGKYADLASIQEHVDPILSRYGLSYRFRTTQPDKGTVIVTCIVEHSAGHNEETSLTSGLDNSGNKTPVQMIGSTATYLQRYTLNAALGLSASHDDDGGSPPVRSMLPSEPVKTIDKTDEQVIESALLLLPPETRDTVLKRAKVAKISDIPRATAGKVKDFLNGELGKLPKQQVSE